jgi:hypothetical protein
MKWLRCEADHSLPSSAEVKNGWRYISSLLYTFMARTGKNLPYYPIPNFVEIHAEISDKEHTDKYKLAPNYACIHTKNT